MAATSSIHFPHAPRFTAWFPDFLRKELAPYPGRGALVARTVISATLTMILIVTFRIPGGVVGALSAFILSREDLLSTTKSAIYIIMTFIIGGLFIPVGARFFASTPETHFLWVAVSLFIAFFLLRTLSSYVAASGFALVVGNVIGIWYLPGPPDTNVSLTLWLVAGTTIGALVTLGVEFVFHFVQKRDDLIDGIDARLEQVELEMRSYAAGERVPNAVANKLAQFAIVGGGSLRRYVARANYDPIHRVRMSTLVSLTGRAVDFAAAMANEAPHFPANLRDRAGQVARTIADIRHCMLTDGRPRPVDFVPQQSPGTPLLSELETMVSLMPSAFSDEYAIDPSLDALESSQSSSGIFVADAFTNPEHLRFVMGGTVASMTCYMFYTLLAWPTLSTSVTTCVLTALTTIGASRQKQVMRLAGFTLGGLICGIGAQIFVLPNIDSITGFTVLFACVTGLAAWIATSSSRLSYAGVQVAFGFYIIHLSEFTAQTSLIVGRDRLLGVLFGVTVMWLVFERLFPRSAGDEMVRIFISNLRLLAELVTTAPTGDDRDAILKIRSQRDQVYRRFGDVIAQSDVVPFETGPMRAGDMAARDRIRRWQAALRTFYLVETPLLQFRLFADVSRKSKSFTSFEDEFRAESSRAFLRMADNLERQLNGKDRDSSAAPSLTELLDSVPENVRESFTERERALLRISRTVAQLLDHMQGEVVAESLYATPIVSLTAH
jgi:multidrug resistance protein MdtO